jgi:hypothetical protein
METIARKIHITDLPGGIEPVEHADESLRVIWIDPPGIPTLEQTLKTPVAKRANHY